MKEELITEIQRRMLGFLNNKQLMELKSVLEEILHNVSINTDESNSKMQEQDTVGAFIAAKRIEGCSEKTLTYYVKTIEAMIAGIGKRPEQITTDEIRKYLTRYQIDRRSSKVTIDNIRRILSSFFSWLEDEDYIIKSPVRRIHKVKTAKTVKDTYTDEALELMRDNCTSSRDLAIIDLLNLPVYVLVKWSRSTEMILISTSANALFLAKEIKNVWCTSMHGQKSICRIT